MIIAVTLKTVKCYNCSTVWQYDDEDIQESVIYDPRHGEVKNTFIKCPKCGNVLDIY